MKTSPLLIAILSLAALSACGKKAAPPSPAPPVAPEAPPPAPPPAVPAAPAVDEYARLRGMSADEIERLNLLEDIYFDYDRSDVRADAGAVLSRNADVLKRFDFLRITVEGHCDERGTVEYNLALGERRARSTADYLVSLGVPRERLRTVSYGKEAPQCSTSEESCWSRNRRAKLRVTGNSAR